MGNNIHCVQRAGTKRSVKRTDAEHKSLISHASKDHATYYNQQMKIQAGRRESIMQAAGWIQRGIKDQNSRHEEHH